MDSIFTSSGKRISIVSALSFDLRHGNTINALETGLIRAKAKNEFIHLYGHSITHQFDDFSITPEYLSTILELACSYNLPVLSYEKWRISRLKSGVVLSFDDNFIEAWHSNLNIFSKYNSFATFFVCKPQQLTDKQIQKLRSIQIHGHEIGCHGAMHLKAADYIKRNSLLGYIGAEIEPSIRHLNDAGFPCKSFSYPFGSHTDETDRILPKYFSTIRCTSYSL
jgi:peptidoglycan/xylan/chitin deacetylase (PgdA/CDA1 family)